LEERRDPRRHARLRILVAAGERAIEALQASANIKDRQLLADLEHVVARSHAELGTLTERFHRARILLVNATAVVCVEKE